MPLTWQRKFAGESEQLGLMRRWLASLLAGCSAADDVTLVATELATNAIQHTATGQGGWFTVTLLRQRATLRVGAADEGTEAEPRLIDDPAAEHGRGLQVVRELSLRYGVCGGQQGRLVWAEIGCDDPSETATQSVADPRDEAIREGQALLARRFAGTPAWFGQFTKSWWALASPDSLVSASSAHELAGLLAHRMSPGLPGLPRPDCGRLAQATAASFGKVHFNAC
jgi:anti-sigma regulatory factor (Ser/Thr protein kinase)